MKAAFLAGLRVLDLGQYVPSPYASQMLADLGAEVIKIEAPGGELMRAYGPVDGDGVSVFYKGINAGKTVIELDLKSEEGKRALTELARGADVLIESFRPGAIARRGFGYEVLSELNPRLVVCSLSGYGQTGPYRLRAGHDLNYMAFSGGLIATGTPETPVAPVPPISDYASGMQAAYAILAAVVARFRTGRGAYLDLSLAETVLAWQSMPLTMVHRGGYSFARGLGHESGGTAYYRLYRTADGRFVSLAAPEPRFWRNFCEAVQRPDWVERQADPVPQTALIGEVAALFAAATFDEWRARLDEVDCCFEALLEFAEVAGHPQVEARAMISLEGGAEPHVQALFPAWIDGQPPARRAPVRFAEAAEVLAAWPGAQ